jgi:hypothetical protein
MWRSEVSGVRTSAPAYIMVAGAPTFLNVEKWGVRGSNFYPYIYYAMSLPTEIRTVT